MRPDNAHRAGRQCHACGHAADGGAALRRDAAGHRASHRNKNWRIPRTCRDACWSYSTITRKGNTTMKKTVLALTSALLFSGTSTLLAQEFTFTFAHVLNESTPVARAAEVFKAEVEKNSDGRIAIEIRPAAMLGGDVEIIEQTQMGLVHFAIPPTANLTNFNEKFYLLDLPFLMTDQESMKRVLDGEVGQEVLGTLGDNNLKGISM